MSILCKLGMHGHTWQDTNGRVSVMRCGRPGCDWVNNKRLALMLEQQRAAVSAGDDQPPYRWEHNFER